MKYVNEKSENRVTSSFPIFRDCVKMNYKISILHKKKSMRYIEGINREQIILFPETVDEYISEDNMIRFLNAYVNSLIGNGSKCEL